MTNNDLLKSSSSQYIFGENVSYRYPHVMVTIEEITPSVAESMLDKNTHNRDEKRVAYSKDMANGKWELNGSTIVFADDGTLLDGQNRLLACIASGKPFITLIVRGLSRKSQESMDIGATRKFSDMLKLRGYVNSDKLATVATALARADKGGSVESGLCRVQTDTFTRRELLVYVEENYESMGMDKIVRLAMGVAAKKTPVGMWGVLIREFLKSGDDNTNEFLSQVKGTHTPSDQVHLLNEKLKRNKDSTKSEEQKIVAAWIIRTWNAWMRGVDMKPQALRLMLGGAHPEAYPQVYVVGEE